MHTKDGLGDRMKRFERAYEQFLTPKTPIIIRVDGKSFHTYAKAAEKPFDRNLIDGMEYATIKTAKHMAGFKLAYTQSDEASFLLRDDDDFNTQGWFGYSLNKLVSVTASLFTANFNEYRDYLTRSRHESDMPMWGRNMAATFDARAFNLPLDDAPNYFLWRQKDWERNSLSMLCQHYFTAKQLHGKNRLEQSYLLNTVNVNWDNLDPQLKNGSYITQDSDVGNALYNIQPLYQDIEELIKTGKPRMNIVEIGKMFSELKGSTTGKLSNHAL